MNKNYARKYASLLACIEIFSFKSAAIESTKNDISALTVHLNDSGELEEKKVKSINVDGLNLEINFLTNNDCYSVGLKNLKDEKKDKEDDKKKKEDDKKKKEDDKKKEEDDKKKKFVPEGVMIHSTASPGNTPEMFAVAWNKSYAKGQTSRQVCVHIFCGDKLAVVCLPLNFRGWHCGGEGNGIYLSIEMCEPEGIKYNKNRSKIVEYDPDSKENKEYFEKTWNNMVKLCAYLCKTFDISVDKDKKEGLPSEKFNVISHKEGHESKLASGHGDPDHWWKFHEKTMNDFREAVRKYLKDTSKDQEKEVKN